MDAATLSISISVHDLDFWALADNIPTQVLDRQSGRFRGHEDHRRLRPRHAAIPIIAMTAKVLRQQIAGLVDADMDDHVGKPFKAPALQEVVGRWATRRLRAGA